MKVTELFSLGANEIKNRLPMATAAKFSTQKIEGKSGKSLLAACISRYNCRIIPIAAIIMIICTFMSVLFENVITDGGSAEIAGEVLILFTAVCGVGFGFYFSGKYPSYYPYVFWGLYLISYCIKVTGCISGAAGLSQTAVTIMVFAAVPVFVPAASAFFLGIIPVWYTILCNINNVSGYYPFTVWGLALLGFFISCSMYSLYTARMINSKRIKDDIERMKMSAVMDSRTDLYNRAYGIEKATELLRSGNSISLLLVDIDNFAEYNRIYGNEKADEVLFAVANCVKIISKPKTDIICRYEGDTILVCLTVKADKEAIVLSEEIRSAVRDMKIPFPEANRYRNITATVSAARGMPGDTYDDIYVRAMRSQSVAKRIGGNCIAFKEHTFRPDGEK